MNMSDYCSNIIAFVGATGSGKTTAIVKFAERIILNAMQNNIEKPKITIITTDSYRVGAFEEITLFGNLLKSSVITAKDTEELYAVLDNWQNENEYIFIDTQGCSPKDSKTLNKLKKLLQPKKFPGEILLVHSATSSLEFTSNCLKSFKPLNYKSIVLTKVDESTNWEMYANLNSDVVWLTDKLELRKIERNASDNNFEFKSEPFLDCERLNVLGADGWEVIDGTKNSVLFRRSKEADFDKWQYKWISINNNDAKDKYSADHGWELAMLMHDERQIILKKNTQIQHSPLWSTCEAVPKGMSVSEVRNGG